MPPFLHLSVIEVLEVAVVLEVHVIVREQEVIKLCAIVIGHGCHIVNDNLVRLGRLEVRLGGKEADSLADARQRIYKNGIGNACALPRA